MRLVLLGQAPFGAKVLEALLDRGEEVVEVYTVPAPERAAPLIEAAEKRGVSYFQPPSLRDPRVQGRFRYLAADLGVLAFVTDIVPINIISTFKLGAIVYHPSILPRHRGASAINWALIMGDARTGVTIFWADAGIDTGPILLQKEVDIAPEDTVGSLYFNKLFPLGVEAMVEAVELIKQGQAPRLPQDHAQATYEPPCEEKHAIIDWGQPLDQVYNLIRGTNPQPGATTSLRGSKLKLYDCEKRAGAVGEPGRVVTVGEGGFAVAAPGGAVLVKRVQPQGAGKVAATDFARTAGLQVGEKLGG